MKKPKHQTNPEEEFIRIRRIAIIAMFSDDMLVERLVLKGGNALGLIYKIGGRSSMDIDLSIDGPDFGDLDDLKNRIFKALKSRFDSEGFVVFDEKFSTKPEIVKAGQDPKWGGYPLSNG